MIYSGLVLFVKDMMHLIYIHGHTIRRIVKVWSSKRAALVLAVHDVVHRADYLQNAIML